MQILDLAVLGKLFSHVLLCRLLMDIRNQNDPPFDRLRVEDEYQNRARS